MIGNTNIPKNPKFDSTVVFMPTYVLDARNLKLRKKLKSNELGLAVLFI